MKNRFQSVSAALALAAITSSLAACSESGFGDGQSEPDDMTSDAANADFAYANTARELSDALRAAAENEAEWLCDMPAMPGARDTDVASPSSFTFETGEGPETAALFFKTAAEAQNTVADRNGPPGEPEVQFPLPDSDICLIVARAKSAGRTDVVISKLTLTELLQRKAD